MSIVASGSSTGEEPAVVVKYRRVSTRDQAEGFGLEEQDDLCGQWLAEHRGVVVKDDFVDRAWSGSLLNRPEMERLAREARSGEFHRILVASVDRVGRTARAAYQWAWDMADLGVHFIAVREGIDTSTEAGWVEFRRHVIFSELEWRRIRERTVAGREAKINYGGWPGGPAPYGYRIVADSVVTKAGRKRLSVLVTDEHEAMVLTVAASLLIDDHMNCAKAAAELNRRGLLTRSGRPWCAANLRSRLSSETVHEGFVTYRKARRKGSSTRKTATDEPYCGAPAKIGVPPILAADRARLLWEALRRTGFQNGRRHDRVYALTGRVTGECGEVYTGASEGEDARRVYRCRGRLSGRCRELNVWAEEFEVSVLKALLEVLRTRATGMGEEREHRGLDSGIGDRLQYERRRSEFDEAIAGQEESLLRKVSQYLEADVDPAFLQVAVMSMREQLDDLRRQRAVVVEWLASREEQDRLRGDLLQIVAAGPEAIGRLSPEQAAWLCEAYDVRVQISLKAQERKGGMRCPVTGWHRGTGTLVPPNPTDEQWEEVVEAVRPLLSKKHFTSKYDIREQFNWMLHRLRVGLSWNDLPLEWAHSQAIRFRQLTWWKKGAWAVAMGVLGADKCGEPVHQRALLPSFRIGTNVDAGDCAA